MEEQPNDRWPQEKSNPLKKMDWRVLVLIVIVFIVTLPILGRFYRFIIPIGAFGFIIYFIYKYSQLGRVIGEDSNTVYPNIQVVFREIGLVFRNYFRPVAIVFVLFLIFSVGGVLLFANYSKKSDTENQFSKMSLAIEKLKNETGSYPETISTLIGSNPLRREWTKDAWGNPVNYTIVNSGFKLISAGKDGVFGNEDDVVLNTK